MKTTQTAYRYRYWMMNTLVIVIRIYFIYLVYHINQNVKDPSDIYIFRKYCCINSYNLNININVYIIYSAKGKFNEY